MESIFNDVIDKIDKDIINSYEHRVRPICEQTLGYLCAANDIDIHSNDAYIQLQDAMLEEIQISFDLPQALERARKSGMFV